MATDWNFSYTKLVSPQIFNIRPSYSALNLKISSGTNEITGASTYLIERLIVGMKIETSLAEFGTREIISLDLLNKVIYFSGNPLSTYYEGNFSFYSNPGYFSEQATPLSGQQIHDNFFYLAEGLTNHQERLVAIEQKEAVAGDAKEGYIKYNSYIKLPGGFYSGVPYKVIAETDFNTSEIFAGSYLDISINNGIDTGTIDNSNFRRISCSQMTPFASAVSFASYCNSLLINNNASYGFGVLSNAFSSSYNPPYDGNWDTLTNAGFYIRFDDSEEQDAIKIVFSNSDKTSITNWNAFANLLNAKFIASGISQKIVAEQIDVGAGDLRLRLRGQNDRTHGCYSFTLENIMGGSFLEDVMRLTSTSAFDFSNFFGFNAENDKVTLEAKLYSFKFVLKEGDIPANLLSKAGFNSSVAEGVSCFYHSEVPSSSTKRLNFDGLFASTEMQTKSVVSEEIITQDVTVLDNITAQTFSGEDVIASDTITAKDIQVSEDTTTKNLQVSENTSLNDTVVAGTTTLQGEVHIENTNNDNYKTWYRKQVLDNSNPQAPITANVPKKDVADSTEVCINDNLSAVDGNFFGTVRIFGTEKKSGRLYTGTASPPSSTAVTLNFDGNLKATAVSSTSSVAYKENIIPCNKSMLDLLNKINVVLFNFNGEKEQRVGFIAEETDALFSGKNQDSMDYGNILGALIKAVQELYAEIKKQ